MDIFDDFGGGLFKKKRWPFVLSDAQLNLHEGIREEAIAYFNKHNIPFWNGTKDAPTGHLLSSQVACLNHLFFVRKRVDAATSLLTGIDSNVNSALPIADGGYVDFEVIGSDNYLGEKSHTRGGNNTSIDAAMLAEMKDGTKKLFVIDWKYTESYSSDPVATDADGESRLETYTPLLQREDSPINILDLRVNAFFIEPYYQLMRQTILAHEIVKANEYGATDYMYIHVIPKLNTDLKGKKTSSRLPGTDLNSAWKGVLKTPEKYVAIDPMDLLRPLQKYGDLRSTLQYLQKRYWQ